MAKWRIKRGDKIAGEVPSKKVRQLAAAGKLRKTDLLCKEGTEKWVVAGNVKGLWQTSSPSQSKPVVAKGQSSAQAAVTSTPASAGNAVQASPADAQVPKMRQATPPQQERQATPPQQKRQATPPQQERQATPPQQERQETPPQQERQETPPQQERQETPPQQERQATPPQQERQEAPPQQERQATPPQQEATETPPQQEATETPPQQEASEPLPQQEASTSNLEPIEESANLAVQTLAEPDVELSEESRQRLDDVAKKPRRKWLVPLIAGGVGSILIMGLVSTFMNGSEPEVSQQQSVAMRDQQSDSGQQRRSRSNSNLSLTQQFFPPNIQRNFSYTTKKFEKNTTVAVYRKTNIEKWDTESALYFHEKDFRNYGQTVQYRVSNGYVQLKAGESWFRFLKLDAKVGDKWTPGDGEDGTVDWTGNGEIELFDFKTVDSTPVAIIEFTAKPELSVPSYLVPAAFDFGFVEDGIGTIEGKLRFELGQGLGMLRADAIVPKGTRHKDGGGRDTSDWIFATRLRKSDTAEQPATDGL